jgi:hypothetical protein
MSAELPPDIVVVPTAGAVWYFLPRPPLAISRLMGGILAAFGLAPIGLGVWFTSAVFRMFAPFDHPATFIVLPFVLFTLGIILFGCLISLTGLWLLAGHTEIVVTAAEIRSAFCFGPLAWRGRRHRGLVRRLVVEHTMRNATMGTASAALSAETDQGRPLTLAWIYPPDWLRPLAADLGGRLADESGPVPVVERVLGRETSARWRRDGAGAVKKPVPGCALFAWGSVFFGAGLFCFVFILLSLVRGDPDDNLQGAYPWKCLWILFPLPFIVPGALVLRHAWRRRKTAGQSPERRKAAEPDVEYPTVLAPSQVSHSPGDELPVRLTPDLAPGWGVAILAGIMLLCSGVLTPLLVAVVNGLRAWDLEYVPVTGFFSLFVGIIWVLLAGVTVKEWREWRLGHPVVELSGLPLYCGEPRELLVALPMPARFRRLRVAVVCEERVSWTEGSDSEKQTRRVHDEPLMLREDYEIAAGEPCRLRVNFSSPAGAMHSFKMEHNEVAWLVRVEGEAERLVALKFTHDFPLPVRPPLPPAGRESTHIRSAGEAIQARTADEAIQARSAGEELPRARSAGEAIQARSAREILSLAGAPGREDVSIDLDRIPPSYEPDGRLAGVWFLARVHGRKLRAAELSVMWFTEGRGDEDLGVHYFERLTAEDIEAVEPGHREPFAMRLPLAPLSYDGVVIKVRWCVRVRAYWDGGEAMAEAPFRLGNVECGVELPATGSR